jgi:hypothetical protein
MTEYIKILDIGAKTGLGTYNGYIYMKRFVRKLMNNLVILTINIMLH